MIRHGRRRPRPGGPVVPLSPDPPPAGADAARGRRPRSRGPGRGAWRSGARASAAMPRWTRPWPIPAVELVVIATPHDSHAELAVRTLEASRHCVVDKVMALIDRGRRPDDRRPRSIGPDAVGLPQPALGLGLRDRQGGPRAGLDRPAAALRKRRLPLRRAARLARQRRGGRHDPARLGRAPGRPGPPARPRALPAAHRLADARSLGGRRQRRARADRPGVRRRPLPGRDQPDLPDRPARGGGSSAPRAGSSSSAIDPQEDALRAGDIDARGRAAPARGHPPPRRRSRARSSRAGCRPSAPTGTATTATSPSTWPAGRRWRSPPNRPARSCACSRPPALVPRAHPDRRTVGYAVTLPPISRRDPGTSRSG